MRNQLFVRVDVVVQGHSECGHIQRRVENVEKQPTIGSEWEISGIDAQFLRTMQIEWAALTG